ncbi:MAG: YtxH domain-containing protein [Flammeovirgaceae bacterium]|nr:YtxH domain-containing protein [Flammeovirgaceae bacterium]
MKTSTKIWTGFITGTILGTVAGILLAPDKGANTRKKLMKRSNELSHDIKESYHSLKDTLGRKIKNGNREVFEEVM